MTTTTDRAAAAPQDDANRELVERLIARCARSGAIPTPHDGVVEEWDNVEEHQARVRRQAWAADLKAAEQEGLSPWTVDRLEDREHARTVDLYVRHLGPDAPKRNLLLVGNLGNGKSATGIAVGHLAVRRGLMARFVTHNRYLAMLRPDGAPSGMTAEQVRRRYRIADVVILDDLGAELDLDQEATEFVRRETVELLGDRLNSGRATVITTNLKSEHLDAVLGPRIMSRVGASAHVLRFTGPDRRRPVRW